MIPREASRAMLGRLAKMAGSAVRKMSATGDEGERDALREADSPPEFRTKYVIILSRRFAVTAGE